MTASPDGVASSSGALASPESFGGLDERETENGPSNLSARCWSAWRQADWTSLSQIGLDEISSSSERPQLALLTATAHLQMGNREHARLLLRQALDWGCPIDVVARFLVSSSYNSIGRACLALDLEASAADHFSSSIRLVDPNEDVAFLTGIRQTAELAQLGMLLQSGTNLAKIMREAEKGQPVSSAQLGIVKSQLELLNHMLSVAQKRGQLAPRSADADLASQLKSRATSQLGQDLWVLEQTRYKKGGFFVEFGATDGVLLSNTLLLETEFEWTGLCAEPNPNFFARLKVNRNCIVSPECIAARTGDEVEFILADEYGGIASYADTDHLSGNRADFRNAGEVIRLSTISLDDFLRKHNAPKVIDYLSIDTEGSEFDILEAFPFDQWDIRFITVEHNFTPLRKKIRALLQGFGYTVTEKQWDDWYSRGPQKT